MKRYVYHPITGVVARLALGAILVYASYHKIADPPDFAKVLFNYKLLPAAWINPAAIYLPWLELVLGLSLITGLGRQAAAAAVVVLFLGFIAALSFNLARECPTICGCFDTFQNGKGLTDAEKFSRMRKEIALDVGLVALASYCLFMSILQTRPSTPSPT